MKKTFSQIQKIPIDKFSFRNFFPWGLFAFIIYFTSVWFFVIREIDKISHYEITIRSIILALAIYGVYNITNYITFHQYPISFAIKDILWGIFSIVIISNIIKYQKT